MPASTVHERPSASGPIAPAPVHPDRDALVGRYLELQPQMQRRFNLLLHRELRDDLHSVTLHQLNVLVVLRQGSVSMRELSRDLDVSESATTAVVDRLVRQGLVERQDDPTDRRVVRLALSETGAALVERLHETKQRHMTSLLAVLTDEQLAQFVSIIETLDAATAVSCASTGTTPSGA